MHGTCNYMENLYQITEIDYTYPQQIACSEAYISVNGTLHYINYSQHPDSKLLTRHENLLDEMWVKQPGLEI